MSAVTTKYHDAMASFEAFRQLAEIQDQIDPAAIAEQQGSIEAAKASLDPRSDAYVEQLAELSRAMECLETFLKSNASLKSRNIEENPSHSGAAAGVAASVFPQADVSEIQASGPFIDPTNLEKAEYNDMATFILTCKVLNAIHADPAGMTQAKLDALAAASVAETDQFFAEMPDAAVEAPAAVVPAAPVVDELAAQAAPNVNTRSNHYGQFRHKMLGQSNCAHIYPDVATTAVVERMFKYDSNRLFCRLTDRLCPRVGDHFIKPFGVAVEKTLPSPFFLFEINEQCVPHLYSSNTPHTIIKKLEDMSPDQRHMEVSVFLDAAFV
jgi:hypothetical protein